MKNIRTRFAPSPTGFLHIGSLRTILFAYLTAKSQGGKFILRIEDTDQKRFVPGSVEKLFEILDWVGIAFDEGETFGGEYGPYTQSRRREIYDKHIKQLLEKKEAYHCFCSSERLQKLREEQQAKKIAPRYDRACRDLDEKTVAEKIKSGEPYVIRQKMPLDGEIVVQDELRGDIKFNCAEIEDQVLIKSDGMPTYQFAVVVDDHLMEISHVTRSDEWIPSFPKNILLYRSFGWDAPKFVHFPVVLNKDGKGKLSKRQGDVTVEQYRDKGYLKEALINFCILLGWHPEGDNEIFTLKEIVNQFNYKKINSSPAIFDAEKLDFFNGYYIRQKPLPELVELCRPYLVQNITNTADENKKQEAFIYKAVALEQERLKKLSDIAEATEFLFQDRLEFPSNLLIWKNTQLTDIKENLKRLKNEIEKIKAGDWETAKIEGALIAYLKDNNFKIGEYLWPLRVALSGKKQSPGPFEIAFVLGKEETINRIDSALNKIKFFLKTVNFAKAG